MDSRAGVWTRPPHGSCCRASWRGPGSVLSTLGAASPCPRTPHRAAPETSVCAELGVYRWPPKGPEDVNGSGFSRLPGSLSGPRSSGPGGCTFARSLSPPGIRSLALPPSLPSPAHPLAPLSRPPHLPSLGHMAPARLSSSAQHGPAPPQNWPTTVVAWVPSLRPAAGWRDTDSSRYRPGRDGPLWSTLHLPVLTSRVPADVDRLCVCSRLCGHFPAHE